MNRFSPRIQNSHRADAERRVPGFLQWIRSRPCAIGGQCAGKIEACHVDGAGGKGTGLKVHDMFCLPMCSAHHGESHQAGARTFEARHSVNLLQLANEYWSHWLNKTPMGKRYKDKQDG